MAERKFRNPVDVAFSQEKRPRHQIHHDKRPCKQRRVKHRVDDGEYDTD